MRSVAACVLLAFPAAAAAQSGSWTPKAAMPTAREQAATAAVGGTIYVFGGIVGNTCQGSTTVEAYDAATDQWTPKAPMPTGRWNAAAVAVNGIIYVIGGSTGCGPRTAVVEAFDPASNTWSTRAPMPGPRAGLAAGAIGNEIYAAGGSTPAETYVSTVDVFDPIANAWHAGVPMPTPRTNAVAGVIGGVLYVATGCCVPEAATRLESFDPANGMWTVRASLNQGRVFRPAEAVVNDRFYVAGGNAGGPLHETEVYDPATNTWSFVAPMPTARTDLSGAAANGKFYAIGGDVTGNDHATGVNEAFEPEAPEPPDTTPPLATVQATPGVLWPPNHALVPIQLQLTATDDSGSFTVEGPFITSSDPLNGTGDGDTAPDWVVDSKYAIRLRAERSGPERGRTYTINYVVRDPSGNSVTVTATVSVPHGGRR